MSGRLCQGKHLDCGERYVVNNLSHNIISHEIMHIPHNNPKSISEASAGQLLFGAETGVPELIDE